MQSWNVDPISWIDSTWLNRYRPSIERNYPSVIMERLKYLQWTCKYGGQNDHAHFTGTDRGHAHFTGTDREATPPYWNWCIQWLHPLHYDWQVDRPRLLHCNQTMSLGFKRFTDLFRIFTLLLIRSDYSSLIPSDVSFPIFHFMLLHL